MTRGATWIPFREWSRPRRLERHAASNMRSKDLGFALDRRHYHTGSIGPEPGPLASLTVFPQRAFGIPPGRPSDLCHSPGKVYPVRSQADFGRSIASACTTQLGNDALVD